MLIHADARHLPLRDGCVDCVVTSPPYWGLRDYGTARWEGGDPACAHAAGRFTRGGLSAKQASNAGSNGDETFREACPICGARRVDAQLGLEATPEDYVAALIAVFREVRRVLKPVGTVWLNLGDSYAAERGGTTMPAETLAGGAGGWMADGSRVNRDRHNGYSPSRHASAIGLKHKDLVGIPWRVAFGLQADGWYLRSDIIWHKPNPMPESVTDRPTKSHEYLFLLAKSERYYFDAQAIAEPVSLAMLTEMEHGYDSLGLKDYAAAGVQNPSSVKARIIEKARQKWHAEHKYESIDRSIIRFGGSPDLSDRFTRNKRSVWTVNTEPYAGAHFAVMPEALVEPCILAGCPAGGLVLDPFCGTGTVLAVAERLDRRGVGVDLAYQDLARERTAQRGLRFTEVSA